MKCPACPLVGRREPCRGESVARFCTLVVEGRTDYAALLYSEATGERAPFAPGEPVAAPPPPPPPDPGPPAGSIEGTKAIERILLYKSCDYRGPVAQCGCTPLRVCYLGKGSRPDPEASYGHVTERDCLACVSGGET